MEANTAQQLINDQEDGVLPTGGELLEREAPLDNELGSTAVRASVELGLIRISEPETLNPVEIRPLSRDTKIQERIGQLLTGRGFSRSADKRQKALSTKRPLRVTPNL